MTGGKFSGRIRQNVGYSNIIKLKKKGKGGGSVSTHPIMIRKQEMVGVVASVPIGIFMS